ncbi:ATP-binding cassette domain-containing protein [Pantoea vagans]|uniref:ATP-binding cassette domain-containing protein n=1 Tax=Pantoea vagans TaxID=470934 RepID=UPI0032082626
MKLATPIYILENLKNRSKFVFFSIFVISILVAVTLSFTPIFISEITKKLQSGPLNSIELIYLLAIGYVLTIGIQQFFSFFSLYLQNILRIECIAVISKQFLFNLYSNRDVYNNKENAGDLSQRLAAASNDIYILIQSLSVSLVPPIIQLIITTSLLIYKGDSVVSSLFCAYSIFFVGANFYFTKKLISAREKIMDSGRKTYSALIDSVNNIPVVRSFNGFKVFFQRFLGVLENDVETQKDYWKIEFYSLATSGLLQLVFFSLAFGYTLYKVILGQSDISHFVLISSYLLIISSPLENVASSLISFVQSNRSLNGFNNYMKISSNLDNSSNEMNKDVLNDEVVLKVRDISFSYSSSGFYFGPINYDFKKGSFVTLTGASGSGKSTFLKIITKELKPDDGTIMLGNMNVNTLSDDSFYDSVSYVSQDDYIFMDTVEFNLRIANSEATREEMLNALKLAHFCIEGYSEDDILNLTIGSDGGNVSGGQRQRLSIARLFLRSPKLIILDEITSSLDLITEKKLMQNLKQFFSNSVIINISHRPSTFKYTDSIIVFQNGMIIESGPFERVVHTSEYVKKILNE